jgi:hypothetical protein
MRWRARAKRSPARAPQSERAAAMRGIKQITVPCIFLSILLKGLVSMDLLMAVF